MQQVLLNILNNAVDAAPEGGTVTCRTRLEDGPLIAFEIEDTGDGVPPDIREKIFDPFFTTKPTGKAAGLGLYVSRKIVEKMGGTIHVDKSPGRGGVFIVRFPLTPPLSNG